MKAYEPIIYPVASMEQWRRTSIDPLEPPKDKIQRGRPKIKRKRHPSEPKNPYKLSKAGTIIKCFERKKVGHNSRTCPSKKDKGTVSTNAKKTPTTNKKRAAGGARATAASAVDSRAKGVKTIAVKCCKFKGWRFKGCCCKFHQCKNFNGTINNIWWWC
ncbi:uncharacterized protein LOC115971202 [Quercus lobata]|uniref:uncharacterized protein LOC115971202 n=1 Tax=Quercus lobata TaxID=97700 RepID=UPI0012462237|nr:uncharacterized protein LOC115971202 [Quercus lobata]